MPASVASGTISAVISTEHTLATNTSGQSFVLVVDTSNMVMGDRIEIRLYTKCKSGGAEQLAYLRAYKHLQGEPIKYSVPVPADVSLRATLTQTAGTGRNYDWSLLSI
jgi:hypothetical protein